MLSPVIPGFIATTNLIGVHSRPLSGAKRTRRGTGLAASVVTSHSKFLAATPFSTLNQISIWSLRPMEGSVRSAVH